MIDLTGKCAIVTGATSGIGEQTARGLVAMGADVILVGRSAEKLAASKAAIEQEHAGSNVEFVQADLSSMADTKRAGNELLGKAQRIDILINNAGGVFMDRAESVDGLEMTFALNHMAYFTLTNLLLDRIKQTAANHGAARIVSVASKLHYRAKINWDDLHRTSGRYSGLDAYNTSKLFNVMFTAHLDKMLAGSGVSANCLHPGVVNSGFGKNTGGLGWKLIMKIGSLFMITPTDGAKTSLFLASEQLEPHHHGLYFDNCKPVKPNPLAMDEAACQRLWDLSSGIAGL